MQDPTPENITGRKVHVVNHEIQWGYVVLGIAAIYIVWTFTRAAGGKDEDPAESGGL